MDAKVCDRCGKVIDPEQIEGGSEPVKTDWVEINTDIIKPGDYCLKCVYAMKAEAGRLYWDNYKQQRKPKNDKKRDTKAD